jgi:hypothetical protein
MVHQWKWKDSNSDLSCWLNFDSPRINDGQVMSCRDSNNTEIEVGFSLIKIGNDLVYDVNQTEYNAKVANKGYIYLKKIRQ